MFVVFFFGKWVGEIHVLMSQPLIIGGQEKYCIYFPKTPYFLEKGLQKVVSLGKMGGGNSCTNGSTINDWGARKVLHLFP